MKVTIYPHNKSPEQSGAFIVRCMIRKSFFVDRGLVSLETISDVLHRAISANSVKTLIGSWSF